MYTDSKNTPENSLLEQLRANDRKAAECKDSIRSFFGFNPRTPASKSSTSSSQTSHDAEVEALIRDIATMSDSEKRALAAEIAKDPELSRNIQKACQPSKSSGTTATSGSTTRSGSSAGTTTSTTSSSSSPRGFAAEVEKYKWEQAPLQKARYKEDLSKATQEICSSYKHDALRAGARGYRQFKAEYSVPGLDYDSADYGLPYDTFKSDLQKAILNELIDAGFFHIQVHVYCGGALLTGMTSFRTKVAISCEW